VDTVLLVGGSTRVPALEELVKRIIIQPEPESDERTQADPQIIARNQLKKNINPDEAVARGAGILAGILSGTVKGIQFFDITPHDLGVEDDQGEFVPLIPKGTAYPTEVSHLFTNTQDNQARVFIHVQQRLGMDKETFVSLGWFELKTDPTKKKGESNIEVTFAIDSNGILKVSALDIDLGEIKSITIQSENGLFIQSPSDKDPSADKPFDNPRQSTNTGVNPDNRRNKNG
jgi:molecular chaperone DnaK